MTYSLAVRFNNLFEIVSKKGINMSADQDILVTIEQHIMSISFNRPEKKNAITDAMYHQVSDAMKQAAEDDDIRVVLFTSEGDDFTSGNDIADFLRNDINIKEAGVGRFLQALRSFHKPIVAAVKGSVVGIGTTMLFHCDFVVAATNSVFAMPFVPLGLCPEAASSLILPKLAGHQLASELLMLGEPFDAEKADKIGLLNRLVDKREVKLQALALCQKISALPVESVLLTKKLLKMPGTDIGDRMQTEVRHFTRLLGQPAAQKAFQSFLSK